MVLRDRTSDRPFRIRARDEDFAGVRHSFKKVFSLRFFACFYFQKYLDLGYHFLLLLGIYCLVLENLTDINVER